MVNKRKGRNDGVDHIDACEKCGAVAVRGEREKASADDAGDAAGNDPSPTMRGPADAEADNQGRCDGDKAGGGVEESGDGCGVAEGLYYGRGVGSYDAARDGYLFFP